LIRTRAIFVAALAGASLASALLLACSSFSDAPPAEAGAAPEASREDGATEEAAPVDAGSFCTGHPGAGLCADFDEGEEVSYRFTGGRGDISVDLGTSLSAPGSLRAVATTAQSSAGVDGVGTKTAAFASVQRLSFDTKQEAPVADSDAGSLRWLIARIRQGADGCTFDIETFGKSARLNVGTPNLDSGPPNLYDNFPLSAYPRAGKWAHVELVLTQDPSGVMVSATIDTVPLPPRRSKCPALVDEPLVFIGMLEATGIKSVEGRFDNVLLESK